MQVRATSAEADDSPSKNVELFTQDITHTGNLRDSAHGAHIIEINTYSENSIIHTSPHQHTKNYNCVLLCYWFETTHTRQFKGLHTWSSQSFEASHTVTQHNYFSPHQRTKNYNCVLFGIPLWANRLSYMQRRQHRNYLFFASFYVCIFVCLWVCQHAVWPHQ